MLMYGLVFLIGFIIGALFQAIEDEKENSYFYKDEEY